MDVPSTPHAATAPPTTLFVACVAGRRLALPLEHVVEILRPLPIEALADAPEGVLGLAVVRGAPLPVFDPAIVFAGAPDELDACGAPGTSRGASERRRWVVVATRDARRVVLAVDDVLGVRAFPSERLRELPPLLATSGTRRLAAVATLDAELVLVLTSARLVEELADALRSGPEDDA